VIELGNVLISTKVKLRVGLGGDWESMNLQKKDIACWVGRKLGTSGFQQKLNGVSGWVGIGHVRISKKLRLHVGLDGIWACSDFKKAELHVRCDGIGTRMDFKTSEIACRICWNWDTSGFQP